MLDHQGRVIAASDLSKTYANVGGKLELLHITSLDNELPAIAFSARPRGSEGLFTFTRDGKDYVASLATLPAEFGKKWQLFIITPLADFTGTVPGQQHPPGHLRPDGDGAADPHHLLPDRRDLLAAREARPQGRQDPGAAAPSSCRR